jgi:hypothetical protein
VSVVIMLALVNVLKTWSVSVLTAPFVLTSWLLLLGTHAFSGLEGGARIPEHAEPGRNQPHQGRHDDLVSLPDPHDVLHVGLVLVFVPAAGDDPEGPEKDPEADRHEGAEDPLGQRFRQFVLIPGQALPIGGPDALFHHGLHQ